MTPRYFNPVEFGNILPKEIAAIMTARGYRRVGGRRLRVGVVLRVVGFVALALGIGFVGFALGIGFIGLGICRIDRALIGLIIVGAFAGLADG